MSLIRKTVDYICESAEADAKAEMVKIFERVKAAAEKRFGQEVKLSLKESGGNFGFEAEVDDEKRSKVGFVVLKAKDGEFIVQLSNNMMIFDKGPADGDALVNFAISKIDKIYDRMK